MGRKRGTAKPVRRRQSIFYTEGDESTSTSTSTPASASKASEHNSLEKENDAPVLEQTSPSYTNREVVINIFGGTHISESNKDKANKANPKDGITSKSNRSGRDKGRRNRKYTALKIGPGGKILTRSPITDTVDTSIDNMSNFIPPSQQRNMRACMVCSIVRTQSQFMTSGCPNCEAFLELAGSQDAIADCTSQVFEGLLTVSDTTRSWAARYQRLEGYVPGVYAVQVEGILPEEVVVAAENAGVHYIPRDGSVSEALPTDA
jgi:transcription elongation factor SPT4